MRQLSLMRNASALLFFATLLGTSRARVQASCEMPGGWPWALLGNEAYGEATLLQGSGWARDKCWEDAWDIAENECLNACTECSGDWNGTPGTPGEDWDADDCNDVQLDINNSIYWAESPVWCECS